ncbi:MAG: N-acetylmuramoyl-L-alanine amidase [Parvibaculaceae bacterium]|nr:N-acetylmuramoyl-L-alanine amidase [Parvibaculaceae bacterium]
MGLAFMVALPGLTPAFSSGMATVEAVRLGDRGAETRFVVEFAPGDAAPKYRLSSLSNPDRIVVELPGTGLAMGAMAAPKPLGAVSGYRASVAQGPQSRLTVSTAGPVSVSKQFFLPAQPGKGPRLVIDLLPAASNALVASARQEPASQLQPPRAEAASAPRTILASTGAAPASLAATGSSKTSLLPATGQKSRKMVVVLDPGHGGVDPGTHGPSGVEEKTITLAFGKELARQLRASGRYTVYMTRSDDTFIPLRGRVAFARAHHADLFMSIHADSIQRDNIRGMSVYTLSETASDKEAAALAQKENRADVIAGIDLKGETPEVTDILIDLAQRETKNYSSHFARSIVSYASQQTAMLDPSHRFAGFAVLKAPDVPSVLVELGFLTNPKDERELTSQVWRRKVAGSFTRAIDSYFGEQLVSTEP